MIDWTLVLIQAVPFIVGALIGYGLVRCARYYKKKKDEKNRKTKKGD